MLFRYTGLQAGCPLLGEFICVHCKVSTDNTAASEAARKQTRIKQPVKAMSRQTVVGHKLFIVLASASILYLHTADTFGNLEFGRLNRKCCYMLYFT